MAIENLELINEETMTANGPLRAAQLVMLEMMKLVDAVCEKHKIDYWIDWGTLLGAVRHGGFIPWDDDADLCMLREDYYRFTEIIQNYLPEHFKLETLDDKLRVKLPWTRIVYLKDFKVQSPDGGYTGIFIDIFPVDKLNPKIFNHKTLLKIFFKTTRMVPQREGKPLVNFIKRIILSFKPIDLWLKYLERYNKKSDYLKYGYGMETGFLQEKHLFEYEDIFPLKEIYFEGYAFKAPKNSHRCLTILYNDYMRIPKKEERENHITTIELDGDFYKSIIE